MYTEKIRVTVGHYNEQSRRMSSVDRENAQLAERVQALSAGNARMKTALAEKDILIVCADLDA